jgi:very-short-patch-repair endonuclease
MARKTGLARHLRREQTVPEELLWSHLRSRRLGGFKFRRQAPLDRYVLDFLCSDAKLILEIDGPTHDGRLVADAARTEALGAMGYLVLRFTNEDVFSNIDGVLDEIFQYIGAACGIEPLRCEPPHPNPLPLGERERVRIVRG